MTRFVTVSASLRRLLGGLALLGAGSVAMAADWHTPTAHELAILPGLPAYSITYDPKRDAEADFSAALQAAAKNNRRVLVMVGGDWCVWCFLLDRHLQMDPEAARILYTGFEVLRVYYNEDNKNEKLLSRFPDFRLFPHFFVVETDATVLASVVADRLIRDARYDTALIRDFAKSWQSPQ